MSYSGPIPKKDQNKAKYLLSENKIDFVPRVYHKIYKRKNNRYKIKCGCCDESFEIFYDKDSLEINGVNGSIESWRKIFAPLLKKGKRKKL